MNPNRSFPGSRLFLFGAAVIGLFRAVDEIGDEARAPKELIHPDTKAAPDWVSTKKLWIFAVSLILSVWAVVLLIYPLFTYFKYARTGGRDPAKVLAYIPPLPPRPRNVDRPYRVLEKFRKTEDGQLDSYEWVDRTRGVVSIPINRAMQIVAERGIPPSKPASGKEYLTPRQDSMLTGFEGKVVQER